MVTVKFRSPCRLFGPLTSLSVEFQENCWGFGFVLNDFSVTATPTGILGTGDPFSIFDAPSPTPGATSDLPDPLVPTAATSSGKTGGAVSLGALQSLLNAGAVGVVAAAAIFMGGLPL
jgi:hypothetical protein